VAMVSFVSIMEMMMEMMAEMIVEIMGIIVDVEPIQVPFTLNVQIHIGEHYLTGETKQKDLL
jgi:hypothetical protein